MLFADAILSKSWQVKMTRSRLWRRTSIAIHAPYFVQN